MTLETAEKWLASGLAKEVERTDTSLTIVTSGEPLRRGEARAEVRHTIYRRKS